MLPLPFTLLFWVRVYKPFLCFLSKEDPLAFNGEQKKAGVVLLISDKIDLEIKAMKRGKEGHYIMIKGLIQEEDITIINIYASNIGA